MVENLVKDLISYLNINTQAKHIRRSIPSNRGQKVFLKKVEEVLKQLGLINVKITSNGDLLATLPANNASSKITMGWLAHIDSPHNVPYKSGCYQLVPDYQGGEIALGKGEYGLSPVRFPTLLNQHTNLLLTSDGVHSLGMEGKASVVEIITALSIIKEKNIAHNAIKIIFLSDIFSRRNDHSLTKELLEVDWICALQSLDFGGIGYQNNPIIPVSVMIKAREDNLYSDNALRHAMRLNRCLEKRYTVDLRKTEEPEFQIVKITGTTKYVEMEYKINANKNEEFSSIRDNFIDEVEQYKNEFQSKIDLSVNFEEETHHQLLSPPLNSYLLKLAKEAIKMENLKPKISKGYDLYNHYSIIDSAIPCLYLFNGCYNANTGYEYVSVNEMEKTINILTRLSELSGLEE